MVFKKYSQSKPTGDEVIKVESIEDFISRYETLVKYYQNSNSSDERQEVYYQGLSNAYTECIDDLKELISLSSFSLN